MRPTLDRLRGASADEAGAYFTEADPIDVVEAVRATSDDDLLDLVGRADLRPVVLAAIVSRLHEYAVPDRLAAVEGVVRFDLERRGTLLERHGLAFDRGAVTHLPDLTERDPVDVVLRTSVLRFVRIVSGERNAGLEYLSGKLDIEGDAELALAVGGLFRVPGTGEVAVDPRNLDPVDVATALKEASTDHLRRVMASGFRGVVLGEIFRRLPDFVDARRARHLDLTIGFRLEGGASGEVDRYVVRLRDGAATVSTDGEEGSQRDATVTCEAHDFLRLATGHLGAVTGVLRGQLKVRGDKAKALQLSSAIDFPKAR